MTTIETTPDQWRQRLDECRVIFGRARAVWELTRRPRHHRSLRLPDHLGGYILRGWEIDRELHAGRGARVDAAARGAARRAVPPAGLRAAPRQAAAPRAA